MLLPLVSNGSKRTINIDIQVTEFIITVTSIPLLITDLLNR